MFGAYWCQILATEFQTDENCWKNDKCLFLELLLYLTAIKDPSFNSYCDFPSSPLYGFTAPNTPMYCTLSTSKTRMYCTLSFLTFSLVMVPLEDMLMYCIFPWMIHSFHFLLSRVSLLFTLHSSCKDLRGTLKVRLSLNLPIHLFIDQDLAIQSYLLICCLNQKVLFFKEMLVIRLIICSAEC